MMKLPTDHCLGCAYCATGRDLWGLCHYCAVDGYQITPAAPLPTWYLDNMVCNYRPRRNGGRQPEFPESEQGWSRLLPLSEARRMPAGYRTKFWLFRGKPRKDWISRNDTED